MEVGKLYILSTRRGIYYATPFQLWSDSEQHPDYLEKPTSTIKNNEMFLILEHGPRAGSCRWIRVLVQDISYWLWFEPEIMVATLIGVE